MTGLKRRLLIHYGLVTAITVVVLETIFIMTVFGYYYGTVERELQQRVTLAATFFSRFTQGMGLTDRARSLMDNISLNEVAEIQVIDWNGRIVASSRGYLPEIPVTSSDVRTSLNGSPGTWIGRSDVANERILSASSPLRIGSQIIGVLRYVVSVEELHRVVMTVSASALLVGALVLALVLVFSLPLARSIINPVQELTGAAERLAAGHYDVRSNLRSDDEIGRLAEAFNYMADEIVKADQMKSDFLSSISHELRTPLTSIKGWSETIYSGDLDDPEETRHGLGIICQETDRMIRLVEELLDFARMQSNRIKLEMTTFQVNELLEQVVEQMSIHAAQKQVQLTLETDDRLAPIRADQDRIRQVFINLVDNAMKFTPPQGAIAIRTRGSDDKVVVSVTDTGTGISPEDLPHVAEKFYKGGSRQPGSGLGLSIVAELVRLHGGQLHIDSELGSGTTVSILLPLTSHPFGSPKNNDDHTPA